jgi:hypothetical protein
VSPGARYGRRDETSAGADLDVGGGLQQLTATELVLLTRIAGVQIENTTRFARK